VRSGVINRSSGAIPTWFRLRPYRFDGCRIWSRRASRANRHGCFGVEEPGYWPGPIAGVVSGARRHHPALHPAPGRPRLLEPAAGAKERAIRRRQLKRLWARLKQISTGAAAGRDFLRNHSHTRGVRWVGRSLLPTDFPDPDRPCERNPGPPPPGFLHFTSFAGEARSRRFGGEARSSRLEPSGA
jgi:hypothetical protein